MIKIAADSQIPNLESRLSELFDAEYSLQYFECDQLKPDDVKDIDALFRCDQLCRLMRRWGHAPVEVLKSNMWAQQQQAGITWMLNI